MPIDMGRPESVEYPSLGAGYGQYEKEEKELNTRMKMLSGGGGARL